MNPASVWLRSLTRGHRSATQALDGLSGRSPHCFHAPLARSRWKKTNTTVVRGGVAAKSTSCSPRLGLCAALLGQHAVMLAASARRLSAAASSSSSSMRASQLAAAPNPQRWMHDRSKKAMELVAKGWSALQEVDRVIDYADRNDKRLIPLLRGAKENFELALEIDNDNTHARYWLGKMHFKYHVPGACKAVGAALLVEAANMGDPDAQYELGYRLRIENDYILSDQQAFHYIEQAVDQLHPGALYLLGAVYLTGDCVKRDIASALWCFHRASEKGHAGAAVAYGSLLLKGVEIPEVITRFNSGKSPSTGKMRKRNLQQDSIKLAKAQFQVAAEAGCDLGLRWLKRLEDYENQEEKLKQIQH